MLTLHEPLSKVIRADGNLDLTHPAADGLGDHESAIENGPTRGRPALQAMERKPHAKKQDAASCGKRHVSEELSSHHSYFHFAIPDLLFVALPARS